MPLKYQEWNVGSQIQNKLHEEQGRENGSQGSACPQKVNFPGRSAEQGSVGKKPVSWGKQGFTQGKRRFQEDLERKS